MHLHIGWPQAILNTIVIYGLASDLMENPSRKNASIATVSIAIFQGLLYWGGFYG